MQRKPRIGLNADYRPTKQDSPAFSFVLAGYYTRILAAGGILIILPLLENEHDANSVLDALEGFVMVGGHDLDPRRDGFMLHPSVRLMDRRRESFDRMLIRVNSMHHMAVDDVAPGFVTTARCPDGIIEAIESEMPDWFAFGTQFHPESDSASALDIRIFEEFIDGVATPQVAQGGMRLLVA